MGALGFRVEDSSLRVEELDFRDQGLGLRIYN